MILNIKSRDIFTFLSVIVIVTLSYFYVDRDLAIYYKYSDALFKNFFKTITDLGKSEWYIIPSLVLFFVFKKYGKLLYARYALYIFTTNVVAGIGVWLLKFPFGRYRPRVFFENGDYGFSWFAIGHNYVSFPSGHSITIMTTVTAFALLFPRYKIPLLFVGAVIAFSRVGMGAHYLSDVIMGSYLGIVVAIVLYHRMIRNYKVD